MREELQRTVIHSAGPDECIDGALVTLPDVTAFGESPATIVDHVGYGSSVPLLRQIGDDMLILAEGTLNRTATEAELASVYAWMGPMVDDGFLVSGYVDRKKLRLWLVISADSIPAARLRLSDVPMMSDGSVDVALTAVTAFRYR